MSNCKDSCKTKSFIFETKMPCLDIFGLPSCLDIFGLPFWKTIVLIFEISTLEFNEKWIFHQYNEFWDRVHHFWKSRAFFFLKVWIQLRIQMPYSATLTQWLISKLEKAAKVRETVKTWTSYYESNYYF